MHILQQKQVCFTRETEKAPISLNVYLTICQYSDDLSCIQHWEIIPSESI